MSNLQATYGNYKVKGLATGLNGQYTYEEGAFDNGTAFKRLRFTVKTSKTTLVPVEIFAMKNDKVFLQNENDKNDRIQVEWSKRYSAIPGYKPFMPIKLGLEEDTENQGKNLLVEKFPYDAVDYIREHLDNGKVVFVLGGFAYNESNKNSEITLNRNNQIQNLYLSNQDFDFEAADFEEIASFNHDIIVIDTVEDKKEKKAYVNAYVIYKAKGDMTFSYTTFTINPGKYEDDEEKLKRINGLIRGFKSLPFGTLIKVNGNIVSSVTTKVVEEEDIWGFNANGQEKRVGDGIAKELEITGADAKSIKKSLYKQSDFVKQQPTVTVAEENPFAGDNDNPFATDDLPFN